MPRSRQPGCVPASSSKGFTLLEVLVALTIAALALGLLLTLIAGSKRLAWRGEDALLETARLRTQINLVRLEDGQGVVPELSNATDIALELDLPLEDPDRLTLDSPFVLRGFEVLDADGRVRGSGSYWLQEDLLQ